METAGQFYNRIEASQARRAQLDAIEAQAGTPSKTNAQRRRELARLEGGSGGPVIQRTVSLPRSGRRPVIEGTPAEVARIEKRLLAEDASHGAAPERRTSPEPLSVVWQKSVSRGRPCKVRKTAVGFERVFLD